MAQIALAITGVVLFLTLGFHPVTWGFVTAGGAALVASRLLYRGQPALPPSASRNWPIGVGLLVRVGVRRVTWAFVIAATVIAIVSRLLYHGQPAPNLKK